MAAECFAANPKLEELKQTSDGLCFESDDVASTHGRTLGEGDKRTVETVKREDVSDEIKEIVGASKKSAGKLSVVETDKASTDKAIVDAKADAKKQADADKKKADADKKKADDDKKVANEAAAKSDDKK